MYSPTSGTATVHNLPSQRELLTSIITSISRISLPAPGRPDRGNQQDEVQSERRPAEGVLSTNPLRLVPPADRRLFTTLHVLFPSLLLPALDLLDRGLVVRVVLDRPGGASEQNPDGGNEPAGLFRGGTEADASAAPALGSEAPMRKEAPSFFAVRSAPPSRPRRGYGGSTSTTAGGGREYVVHLAAWNCTCAAFGFAAAGPPARPTLAAAADGGHEGGGTGLQDDNPPADDGVDGDVSGWQFGGLSLDGVPGTGVAEGDTEDEDDAGGGVPCCKHLLACVLADRWEAALGRYVVVRRASREEMAGIMADI